MSLERKKRRRSAKTPSRDALAGMLEGAPPCESHKRAFESKGAAKLWVRRWQSRGIAVQRPYRCPGCGLWHLTSLRERY